MLEKGGKKTLWIKVKEMLINLDLVRHITKNSHSILITFGRGYNFWDGVELEYETDGECQYIFKKLSEKLNAYKLD